VRYPLQLGILIGICVTPLMTMTDLMLSILMTIYIFIGLHYEEKYLVNHHGDKYKAYQKRVPMILPLCKGSSKS
jgi:protein-S-isoprenylcysteine O-methyltransferase Ste14